MLEFFQVKSYHGDCDIQKRIKIWTWYWLSANFRSILERTIYEQLHAGDYLHVNNLLHSYQSDSVRSLHSTWTALLETTNGFLNRAAFKRPSILLAMKSFCGNLNSEWQTTKIAVLPRVILKVYYEVNSSSLLEILKWTSYVLWELTEKQKAVMMFKPLHRLPQCTSSCRNYSTSEPQAMNCVIPSVN